MEIPLLIISIFPFLLILNQIYLSQSVSFQYLYDDQRKSMIINATISSSQIPIQFCIDLTGNYSYITKKLNYSQYVSSSLEISTTELIYFVLKGNISSDIVSFRSNPIISNERLLFIYSTQDNYINSSNIFYQMHPGCLSLSRSLMSFLENLCYLNVISKKIISFGYDHLYLGEINPALKQKKIYEIPLRRYQNKWSFNITGLGIGKGKRDRNKDKLDISKIKDYYNHYSYLGYYIAYFSTVINNILLPKSYKDIFIREYFVINNKIVCDTIKIDRETEAIECNYEDIANLPNISFIIDNTYEMRFEAKQLFNNQIMISKKVFAIQFVRGLYKIVFGNAFIRSLNLIFNEEEKYIGLYSDDISIIDLTNETEKSTIIIKSNTMILNGYYKSCVYVIIITITLFGGLGLLYIKTQIQLNK